MIDLYIVALNKYEIENTGIEMPEDFGWTFELFMNTFNNLSSKLELPMIIHEKSMLSLAASVQNTDVLLKLKDTFDLKRSNNIYSDFEKRKYAFIYCSTTDLSKVDYHLGSNVDYKIMHLYNNEPKLFGECISYGIFKQEDKKKLEMCIKFIDFLTNEEEQLSLCKYNAFTPLMAKHIYHETGEMSHIELETKENAIVFLNTLTTEEKVKLMHMYEKTSEP